MFTQDFALNRISIRGEVSNCKYHTSGHIYFTLKDGGAQIAAVMFAGQRKGLDFELSGRLGGHGVRNRGCVREGRKIPALCKGDYQGRKGRPVPPV
ncbi:MAG: exodeoxyribonuclease VII large subunit [Enterocloster clostridioformis]